MSQNIEKTPSSVREQTTQTISRLIDLYHRLDRVAKISFWVIVLVASAAIFAPIISPYGPAEANYDVTLQGPSLEHPMGTDLTGRDIATRLLFGGRISLLVSLFAVSLALVIGIPLGALAGFTGGWVDELLMRVTDIMISFPSLVLALALVGALGPSLFNVVLVIGIVYSPQHARLIRGQVLSVKEDLWVEAAESTGISKTTVLFKHILPNSFAPNFVQATFHMATAIIFEASLSFLGLGVQPPTASWGKMISAGRNYLPEQWWWSVFPGIIIFITVISFNLLGDSLREEFDPRSSTKGGPEA